MLWFSESISAAITKAQQNNTIFLVYIRGTNDDDTSRMDETWEDGEVQRICNEAGIVAIRLNASSTECNQFSEHYPVVCVPSVSFIDGGNGVYLEAIAGAVTPQELREKIKNMIAKKNMSNSNQASAVSTTAEAMDVETPIPQAAADPLMAAAPQASAAPVTSTVTQASTAPKFASDQPDKVQTSSSASAEVNTSNETIEERAQRLRQKMVALQEKKEKKRKETEKKKEIDRREVGKAMQEQRKKNQEREAIRAAEELKKEKKEEQQHRKLVREQLERDKLEKKARFEAEKRERDQKRESRNIQKQEQQDEEELERKRRRMESARIQFRLPDGSTFTNRFQATATLSEVHEFIKQTIMSDDLRSSFMMSTMYPRRNYDSGDMGHTLTELNLVPDASIIVLPGSTTVTQSDSLVLMLLWPFLALWKFIMALLFGKSSSPQPSNPSTGNLQRNMQGSTSDQSSGEPGPSTGARPKSSYGHRRNVPSRGMRQEGNIYRLSQGDDDDDENKTWNGNSTQQM
ncbi:UBX domain-containing protein 4-like isoform X2 [Anneissia japonica]|uniref:UBX domain-containing protein 4-like isoform X2 n=1 Tax=Anneissia japonica TaxID=1529436 RepID=UPI001425B6EF|nr:UBX domain-containing protein 4-like isoform X2 [Anneissia japonica]